MSLESELCKKLKQRPFWDKIRFSPSPHSRLINEGYRINISAEREEDIEHAKEFLEKAHIFFEDKTASSFSETIEPGDRTLRVTHQLSVNNLRKMWANEFEKSRLRQTLKKQQERK